MKNKTVILILSVLAVAIYTTAVINFCLGDAPEEQLTDEEKRIRRMAEEYDQLRSRFEEMTQFRDTEEYKQMSENKRVLYDRQCKAMDDYESALRERIRIDAEAANLRVDINDPDDE